MGGVFFNLLLIRCLYSFSSLAFGLVAFVLAIPEPVNGLWIADFIAHSFHDA